MQRTLLTKLFISFFSQGSQAQRSEQRSLSQPHISLPVVRREAHADDVSVKLDQVVDRVVDVVRVHRSSFVVRDIGQKAVFGGGTAVHRARCLQGQNLFDTDLVWCVRFEARCEKQVFFFGVLGAGGGGGDGLRGGGARLPGGGRGTSRARRRRAAGGPGQRVHPGVPTRALARAVRREEASSRPVCAGRRVLRGPRVLHVHVELGIVQIDQVIRNAVLLIAPAVTAPVAPVLHHLLPQERAVPVLDIQGLTRVLSG